MAVRTLTQLVADLKTSSAVAGFNTWKFGYLGEVNSSISTNYPLILLTPPTSTYENPYKSDESLRLEFHMFRTQIKEYDELTGLLVSPNNNQTLEKTYDLLRSMFFAMLDDLLQNHEHHYIIDGGLDLERISQVHNDNLVGLEATIRMRKFSPCLSYSTGTDY